MKTVISEAASAIAFLVAMCGMLVMFSNLEIQPPQTQAQQMQLAEK